jgi:hypothetical protein
MGRPAKKIDASNAQKVLDHIKGKEERSHTLKSETHSHTFKENLNIKTFSKAIEEDCDIRFSYIYEDKMDAAVICVQKFVDQYMSGDDCTRMWKVIRKRNNQGFSSTTPTFQLSLDGISNYSFNHTKKDILYGIGLKSEDISNSDFLSGIMYFVSRLNDDDAKNRLRSNIKNEEKRRKQKLYQSSDLYKKRDKKIVDTLLELGLNNQDEVRDFMGHVKLPAFNDETILVLINSKMDKNVAKYLTKLKQLKHPGELNKQKKLSNWVALPNQTKST